MNFQYWQHKCILYNCVHYVVSCYVSIDLQIEYIFVADYSHCINWDSWCAVCYSGRVYVSPKVELLSSLSHLCCMFSVQV